MGQDLGNNKNKKLVKSKSSNFDSDVDADVEDELSESDLAVISKPKLVRKSATLSLTSPEKGLLKSSHSDLKSGIETNVNLNRSYRRAAASKASDRINRESRGRLSLSSSSSDDSRISDLDRGVEDLIKKSRNLISDDDSDFNPKPSNDSQKLCESSVIPSSATTTSRPSSQGVVKIPLKRKVSTGTGNAEAGGTSAE